MIAQAAYRPIHFSNQTNNNGQLETTGSLLNRWGSHRATDYCMHEISAVCARP